MYIFIFISISFVRPIVGLLTFQHEVHFTLRQCAGFDQKEKRVEGSTYLFLSCGWDIGEYELRDGKLLYSLAEQLEKCDAILKCPAEILTCVTKSEHIGIEDAAAFTNAS
jgi:hypothetical protein